MRFVSRVALGAWLLSGMTLVHSAEADDQPGVPEELGVGREMFDTAEVGEVEAIGSVEADGFDASLDACCNDGCQDCAPRRTMVAGAEATYLRPQFHDRSAQIEDIAGDFVRYQLANLDDLEAAPRFWIGFERECGWGFRTRYWRLEGNDRHSDVDVGTLFTTSASNRVAADALDLEATHRNCWRGWSVLSSIGARQAGLEHGESLQVADLVNSTFSSVENDRHFNGWGITGGFEGTRPIHDTCWSTFWSARGSVLWGNSRAVATSLINDAAGPATIFQEVEIEEAATQFIIETQAGIEWSQPLQWMEASAFLRLAFEYQYWDRDRETPFSLDQTLNFTTVTIDGRSSHVDFIGLAFAAGLTW